MFQQEPPEGRVVRLHRTICQKDGRSVWVSTSSIKTINSSARARSDNESEFLWHSTETSLFTQKTAGASVTASAPLQYFAKRFRMGRFIRLGLSYSFQTTDIVDPAVNRDSDPTNDILVTFRQSGVTQSTVAPSIVYNTLNSSLDPTKGTSVTFAAALTGGPLGGKVNTIAPSFEYKHFRPLFAGRESRARLEAGKPTRTLGVRFFVCFTLVHSAPRSNRTLCPSWAARRYSHASSLGRARHKRLQHRVISLALRLRPASPRKRPRDGLLDGKSPQVRKPAQSNGNSVARASSINLR